MKKNHRRPLQGCLFRIGWPQEEGQQDDRCRQRRKDQKDGFKTAAPRPEGSYDKRCYRGAQAGQ